MKRWVFGSKIFDSSIVDLETRNGPAYGALGLGPEVCLQPVDEYVCSTLDVDISFFSAESYGIVLASWRTRQSSWDRNWALLSTPLDCYSAQQLSCSMSFRKDVATSLMDSAMVGKTWTVSMISSMVSLNLTASTASWIMSAAFSARIWTPRILPLVLSATILMSPLVSRIVMAFGTFDISTVLHVHLWPFSLASWSVRP